MNILRNVSIKTQLLGSFFIVSLTPILIVSGIAYWLIKDSVEESAVLSIQDILQQVSHSVANELQLLEDMSIKLYSHPDILRIIGQDTNISTSEHDEDTMIVLSVLNEMTRSKTGMVIQLFDFIRQVEGLEDDVGVFTSSETTSLVKWNSLQDDPLFFKALDSKGKQSPFGHLTDASWSFSDEFLVKLRVINHGRILQGALSSQTIVRINRNKPAGMMLLCLREDDLRNIYTNSNLVQTGHIYLMNPDGEILTSSDKQALQRPFTSPVAPTTFQEFEQQASGHRWIAHHDQSHLLSFQRLPRSHLMLYTLQPRATVLQNFYYLRNGLFVVSGMSILLALGFGLVSSLSLTRPISALTNAIRTVKRSGYTFDDQQMLKTVQTTLDTHIAAQNEIGVMAEAFEKMLGEIEESQHQLREQERLKKEMELAREIQTSLLPKSLRSIHPDFDIAACMLPAEEVGGDYYDVTFDQDGHLWIGIGDVSGHGVTPGLIMMMAQTVHTTITSNCQADARDVVVMVNNVLYKNLRERLEADHFMTFNTLKYLGNGRFQYAGAHLPHIIYRHRDKRCERIQTVGTWLNFIPDISSATQNSEMRLDIGDVLILYTDGITEAHSHSSDELLDMHRFVEIIENYGERDVEDLREAIMTDVLIWCDHTRHDDMSLVILRRIA